jgi:hypothetical protein
VIEIFDLEFNDEIEEGLRSDNKERLNSKHYEPDKKLTLIGGILSSIGGILYFLTVFMVSQTYTGSQYPSASGPFLVAGVISVIGTIIGIKDIKAAGLIILLSIPVTFVISFIFMPYLDCFLCFIGFVLIPFPLPHSIFVINGGILCVVGAKIYSN